MWEYPHNWEDPEKSQRLVMSPRLYRVGGKAELSGLIPNPLDFSMPYGFLMLVPGDFWSWFNKRKTVWAGHLVTCEQSQFTRAEWDRGLRVPDQFIKCHLVQFMVRALFSSCFLCAVEGNMWCSRNRIHLLFTKPVNCTFWSYLRCSF